MVAIPSMNMENPYLLDLWCMIDGIGSLFFCGHVESRNFRIKIWISASHGCNSFDFCLRGALGL
jgi:hypothetical protein